MYFAKNMSVMDIEATIDTIGRDIIILLLTAPSNSLFEWSQAYVFAGTGVHPTRNLKIKIILIFSHFH